MYQDTYYVDKSSGTFSDALMAFGAADVLRRLQGEGGDVQMVDTGAAYELRCRRTVTHEAVMKVDPFVCAPFIFTPKNKDKLPESALKFDGIAPGILVNYEVQKQQRIEFFEQRKLLPDAKRIDLMRGKISAFDLGLKEPHSDWDVFRAINPGALSAYNGLMEEWWLGYEKAFVPMIEILLMMLTQTPNQVEEASAAYAKLYKTQGWGKLAEVTSAQVFNPSQGKGQNRSKADGLSMGNIKGFWMPEYLKSVGFYKGGITRIVANPKDPRNAKDRKTYALQPQNLSWQRHALVLQEFKRTMSISRTALQLDILAVLRYTQAFLRYWETGAEELDLEAELTGHSITEFVSGTQVAFYKNLGNSPAVMNISTLNLPNWLYVREVSDISALQSLLAEHESIVLGMDESHGDQYNMLNNYRTFFTGGEWDKFFVFTAAYSSFVIQQHERRKPAKQFTTTNLEVMMKNSNRDDFTKIIASDGFQSIAAAIRDSTVIPQARKANKQGASYQVRYGLGQDLTRHANYADDFIAALSDFVRDYNRENEQFYERTKKRFRTGIRTNDLDEIVALIAEFGSRVVCNMLVAYGYARTPRDGEQKHEGELPQGEVEETDGNDADDSEGQDE